MRDFAHRMRSCFAILLVTLALAASQPTQAAEQVPTTPAPALAAAPPAATAPNPPSAEAMALDVLIMRPLMVAATAIGTGLFLVSLPFTVPGGDVGAAAQRLVVDPARYTFVRPLGDFGR